MNTQTNSTKGSRLQLNARRAARAGMFLLLLLTLPAVVQAQFNYVITNGTVTITGYTGPVGDVIIPDTIDGSSVTSIGSAAFYNGATPGPGILTSITIPDSVTSIGDYAFAWNGSLRSATLGNGLISIGTGAFADCGLTTITIPSDVISIGDLAFAYCWSLTGVYFQGDAPSLGGSSVFQGDNNYVYYLSGTTGWGATYGGRPTVRLYPQVPWIYTTNNSRITITGYMGPGGAVTIPSTINGYPVSSIGAGAFSYCTNLTSVTIPDSVTSIGDSAFLVCDGLTNVTIGTNVTSIGDSAFYGCTNLTNITIPNSVTDIGNFAFGDCLSLTSVTIPNSVTDIGNQAFDHCTSLMSATIGNSVTNIGSSTFYYCTSLTAITVGTNNPAYSSVDGVLFNKSQTALIQCPGGKARAYTIPSSVTSIGDSAFFWCASLTSVTIPNGVASIGNDGFYACTSLTNITIPNSVTSIGEAAFWSCTNLTSVTIPNSVTSIGNSAFWGCANLTSVTIPNSVTSIGNSAFWGCANLTSMTMGSSVTSVGPAAFQYCRKLTSITIPNSVTSIGNDAFLGCQSLTSVTIPSSVTNIGDQAFFYCTSLTAITVDALDSAYSSVDGVLLNKSQTTLMQCPAGKAGAYTIPNSVTSIVQEAFSGCTSLTSVTIPNSVTTIRYETFSGCGLTNLTIPNSVTNIGDEAFYWCASLTSVTIPNSVTSIGYSAFCYCTSLSGVYFLGNAPSVGSSVFNGDNNAIVYYLPGTTGWRTTFGGRPTAVWIQVPIIQTPPQTQTAEAGSAVGLWVDASSPLPLFYRWRLNGTNLMSWSTNCELELTSLQFSQSGAYSVVVSNVLGAATSSPAMLNVIAPVERRPVPGVQVTSETGSLLNVDCASSLSPAPNWTTLGSVSLTSTSHYYFDLTLPLPPQRFYRAWQTGTPSVLPSLSLAGMVPAITLTGNIGGTVRLHYINQFGPTDAWVTLDTVTLTNTSQLYFDVSAPGQPQRLYRLVPLP